MPDERTQFDYLLNAVEQASQHVNPASQDYAGKRRALFAYVRGLEAGRVSRVSDDVCDEIVDELDDFAQSVDPDLLGLPRDYAEARGAMRMIIRRILTASYDAATPTAGEVERYAGDAT